MPVKKRKAERRASHPEPVTLDMISAGVAAYADFDPKLKEPDALVYAIIHRALAIAARNRSIS